MGTLSGLVELAGNMLITYIASLQVIRGTLSLGEMLVFNSLLGYFTGPVRNLIGLQPVIQTAMVSSDRLGEILDLEQEQKEEKTVPEKLAGDIEIRGLDFRYGKRELVLRDINMDIRKGEKVALVGESGSGKTTLAKLLLKFYEYEKGEISIGGFDIQDMDSTFLRERVSYISQDTFLFNKTIRENLMTDDSIKMDDIVKMSRHVNAYEFISRLPRRFDYVIEENGTNLSAGQKQRLCILRAILRKPDILIMDEATSSLDTITENMIQKMLRSDELQMTVIMIAHRLSTILMCDRIYVLDGGKIIESGTHDELMGLKGKYYKLWKEQGEMNEGKNIQV